ncbi:MAG: ABC transporter ATP-binding protein [Erysipelotrichaceae bacterium]
MIQLSHVSKSFDTKKVLDDVNWEVPQGSIFGLVGPNGAGKSTILRLISGVLLPDQGEITIAGQNVYNNPSVKKKILFVPDDPYFLPQTTLAEMKKFYEIFYPSFKESMYRKLLNNFPINEHAKINTFSKGMKRQANVILALSILPEVLLLDEAFDGLDPVMRLTLKRILTDQLLERKFTVVISSHNLRELEDICDRIALISDGKVGLNDEIENIRALYHKFQVGYSRLPEHSVFESFNPMHLEVRGNVAVLVIKGDAELLKQQLSETQPVLLDEIPITMEEVFVYEMEGKGYGQIV